jgi:hypothetical protein
MVVMPAMEVRDNRDRMEVTAVRAAMAKAASLMATPVAEAMAVKVGVVVVAVMEAMQVMAAVVDISLSSMIPKRSSRMWWPSFPIHWQAVLPDHRAPKVSAGPAVLAAMPAMAILQVPAVKRATAAKTAPMAP